MWHLFWHNQYFKFLLILPCLLVSREVFCQDQTSLVFPRQDIAFSPDKIPGILFPLEQIVTTQTSRLNALNGKANSNPASISTLDQDKPIRLEPTFLRSVLIHTEPAYLALARQSECAFYAALENGLLRGPEGVPTTLPVLATAKGKETEEIFGMERVNFLNFLYRKNCASNRDLGALFTTQNLSKSMQGFSFSVPKTETQCRNILTEWAANTYLPYLCGMHEKIEDGNRAELQLAGTPASDLLSRRMLGARIRARDEISSATTLFQRNYVGALCSGLDEPNKFCAPFLTDEIWPKVVAGEKPAWLIDRRCEEMMNKSPIAGRDLVACAGRLKSNPSLCTTLGARDYPALFPKPDCKEYSDALLAEKLVTRYRDCPGNLDNGTITNGFRLWSHFQNKDVKVTPVECAQTPALAFAEVSLQIDPKEGWPLAVCYQNRAREQRECLAYVPGPHASSPMGENNVIKKILVDNYGMGSDGECRIIRANQFNPSLLEYKNGCFIIYEDNICTLTHCRRRIVLNEKVIEGIEFTGRALFSYFPDSIAQTKSTLQSLLRETLQVEPREIRNLTELTFYLRDLKNAIVHGVGCAEEILPSFFKREALNQCTPLPFILDGISKRGNGDDIVVRTTLDDIHSPRLIPWNFIFNGVSAFREQHLLKTWTLYGIKI